MKKLFLIILFVSPLFGMERIRPENIVAPKRLGNIDLRHDDNGLYLMKDGEAQPIEHRQCDEVLRNIIALKHLNKFQNEGYISVDERNNELALEARGRIRGGGPWVSAAVFLGCQVVGFTGLMTGAVVANTMVPGAGNMATAIALGSGGVPAAVSAIELWALKCSMWAFALPTP